MPCEHRRAPKPICSFWVSPGLGTDCRYSEDSPEMTPCAWDTGRIVEITDAANCLAKVDVSGVQRTISVKLLERDLPEPDEWVLVHVGFAMAKIDEKEALLTLAAVQKLGTAYTDEMDAFRGTA